MENIFVNSDQHKLLVKHKKSLESNYCVQLSIPKIENSSCNDLIFVMVEGNEKNINKIKDFIHADDTVNNKVSDNGIPIITISDSDEEPIEKQQLVKRKKTSKKKKIKKQLETTIDLTISQDEDINSIENVQKQVKTDILPLDDFIPLCVDGNKENSISSTNNDDIIFINTIPNSLPKKYAQLRPIVIDGSNVAREHGKKQNAFSCKGVKLCVDYFLKRGHTQVKAFIPKFRRDCKRSKIETLDQGILEELEKTGHLVCTPSRKIPNGHFYQCYDDRFVVEFASQIGGVIVSNDNFKDLIGESEAFKETIEQRLLMYCFADDIFMIPNDPLGKRGPKLDEFLSFPLEDK